MVGRWLSYQGVELRKPALFSNFQKKTMATKGVLVTFFLLFLSAGSLFSNGGNAQIRYVLHLTDSSRDSIIYVFPDFVEKEIFKLLRAKEKEHGERIFYGFLRKNPDESFTLFLLSQLFDPNFPNVSYYTRKTNRFFVVGDALLPLVLETDEIFGTSSPSTELGEMGKRHHVVYRQMTIIEPWATSVTFTERKLIKRSE
jgi:hypothetical protein